MNLKSIVGIFALISLFSGPTLAQQEADSLSLGSPLNLPNVGEPYIAKKIGDWSLQCVRKQESFDTCEMNQLLLNNQQKPMSEISIFRLSGEQGIVAGANIVVPLETLLTVPLTISFDAETVKRYPYSFCNAIGCIARVGLTEDEITILKDGTQANITVVHISQPDRSISFGMSLNGFTAAYSKTSVLGN